MLFDLAFFEVIFKSSRNVVVFRFLLYTNNQFVSLTFPFGSVGYRFYTRADVTTDTMRLQRESRVINVRYTVSVTEPLL